MGLGITTMNKFRERRGCRPYSSSSSLLRHGDHMVLAPSYITILPGTRQKDECSNDALGKGICGVRPGQARLRRRMYASAFPALPDSHPTSPGFGTTRVFQRHFLAAKLLRRFYVIHPRVWRLRELLTYPWHGNHGTESLDSTRGGWQRGLVRRRRGSTLP